jgi:hypothetical protein
MKRKVINNRNLPARLPLWSTVTTGLVLDRLNAPGWLWGALSVFFVLIWAAVIQDILTSQVMEEVK